MIGSYTINRISVENNMNAYSSDASCREFSLLIHTTWRAFWNICLQLFLCFVVIAIGCYYNMKWTQLFKAILGKNSVTFTQLTVPLLISIISTYFCHGMIVLAVWIRKNDFRRRLGYGKPLTFQSVLRCVFAKIELMLLPCSE